MNWILRGLKRLIAFVMWPLLRSSSAATIGTQSDASDPMPPIVGSRIPFMKFLAGMRRAAQKRSGSDRLSLREFTELRDLALRDWSKAPLEAQRMYCEQAPNARGDGLESAGNVEQLLVEADVHELADGHEAPMMPPVVPLGQSIQAMRLKGCTCNEFYGGWQSKWPPSHKASHKQDTLAIVPARKRKRSADSAQNQLNGNSAANGESSSFAGRNTAAAGRQGQRLGQRLGQRQGPRIILVRLSRNHYGRVQLPR